jgi:hypothetical protein
LSASFSIIYCIDCGNILYAFFNIYFPKFLGLAFAIQSLNKNQLDVNELYTEVMKIEGFDEITLGDAFNHLVQNEMLAKAFMVKMLI